MAEEQGTQNEEISDGGKMDALMDMIKDACSKIDEGHKRLDARMDAVEENFRRMDAAKADEDEDESKADGDDEDAEADDGEEVEGEPKEPVADKRKDADDEDAEADEDEDEKMADHAPISRAEAAALRNEIAALQSRAPGMISDADRERFAAIQEQADPVFQAFNDRAPAPMQGETPTQYKRRLGAKLQGHSPKWKDHRLSAIADEGILDTVLADVYADSMAAARRGVDVPAGHLRMITRNSGGHVINEFEGTSDAWINQFAGHSQRATGDWRRPH